MVKAGAGPSVTVTEPPDLHTTRSTRARPSPRPPACRGGLVEKPSWKIEPAAPGGMPGPVSLTRMVIPCSSSAIRTVTWAGGGPRRAASIALSMRLPRTVTTVSTSSGRRVSRESSVGSNVTSRSAATVALATMRAVTTRLLTFALVEAAKSSIVRSYVTTAAAARSRNGPTGPAVPTRPAADSNCGRSPAQPRTVRFASGRYPP